MTGLTDRDADRALPTLHPRNHDGRIRAIELWFRNRQPVHLIAAQLGCTPAELIDTASRERWPRCASRRAS
jgi:hypothetical protein